MSRPYRNIRQCRICGNHELTAVLSLGRQYLSSYFVKNNSRSELSAKKIPLTLVLCDRSKNSSACGLVQLRETVARDLMYKKYFYRSAINQMMRTALKDVVSDLGTRVDFRKGDYVLDIGCNDGTMLTYFPRRLNRIGLDPAQNINRSSLDKSIIVETDYFSKEKALTLSGGSLFKCITSIAMFYDLDDPNNFVSEIKSVLDPEGVWCIQLSYLASSIKTLNFYDICHEHLTYYTLGVLSNLMTRHGLYVFDASVNDVNGGSLRVFITHSHNQRPVSANLKRLYTLEGRLVLEDASTYRAFAKRIENLKMTVRSFIKDENKNGGLVVGLGASTKGNILLQYFNIDKRLLPYISERNPEKVGLRTLGTDIKLISEDEARSLNPSAMPVLIWFFKDEIIKREKAYLKNGGKLFFPMPYPHIVTKDGEYEYKIIIA